MPAVSKPCLLARRIAEHNIPPWPAQALYERVLIFRIPDNESAKETIGETGLYKPETRVDIDKNRSPRGVVVSAGLRALDILRCQGMELGELVWFAPHVPFRFRTSANGVQDVEFYFMNVGDIIMSEDVLGRLAPAEGEEKAELEIVCGKTTGFRHMMLDTATLSVRALADPTHSPDEI